MSKPTLDVFGRSVLGRIQDVGGSGSIPDFIQHGKRRFARSTGKTPHVTHVISSVVEIKFQLHEQGVAKVGSFQNELPASFEL